MMINLRFPMNLYRNLRSIGLVKPNHFKFSTNINDDGKYIIIFTIKYVYQTECSILANQ